MFPALLVGLVFGLLAVGDPVLVVPAWTVLYGLALHAASSFMPRGVRLFAWLFLVAGIVTFFAIDYLNGWAFSSHLLMGIIFGASHLAYGIYLYFTEPRKNEA
jgi:hypothetical protein